MEIEKSIQKGAISLSIIIEQIAEIAPINHKSEKKKNGLWSYEIIETIAKLKIKQ